MISGTPFFSIIMPIYNREKFIVESINTVLNQRFSDFELVCVDDGSKDKSVDVIKTFQEKDTRVKLISQSNSGRCKARNAGIKAAIGKWVCFLDSDDGYLDNHLQVLYDLIISNPEVMGFATEQIVDRFVKKYDFKKLYKNKAILDINDFIQTNPVSLNQFCYNRETNKHLFFPDIDILCAEDLLFMRMFTIEKKILKVNIITNYVNEHSERSVNQVGPSDFAQWNRYATEYFLSHFDMPVKIKNKIQSCMLLLISNVLLSSKLKKEGIRMLFKSLKFKDSYSNHLLLKGFVKILL